MSVQSLPISSLIRSAEETEGTPVKRSRENFKKEQDLKEQRKAGSIPALVDELGRDINPHIPEYIASAPWYYAASGPTLVHQRQQGSSKPSLPSISSNSNKGKVGPIATRYRKGACENCGAMGHNRKSCFERPRKVPAKVSGLVIAPDDVPAAEPDSDDYDAKRDSYNNYDPRMFKKVIEDFNKLEEAKKVLKEDTICAESAQEKDSDSESEEEDKYADKVDMPGTKVDSKQRITVRNLRIREDTAKYLRNLDPDSAYYDPKTRSMRENPLKDQAKDSADLPYAGENYLRYSGESAKVAQMQVFAWQAREKGADINLMAQPTKAEIIVKQYEAQKSTLKSSIKKSILEKYGGEEYLKEPPKDLIFGQKSVYVEFNRDGRPKNESAKTIIRSRYEEDVFTNDHTTVWGSYYDKKEHKWGYKCCQSVFKNSYCTGINKSFNTE